MVKLILNKPLQAWVAVQLHYSYAVDELVWLRAQKPL